MIAFGRLGVRIDFLLLGILLALLVMAPAAWPQADATPGAVVSLSDLERLVQQIEDPHQREQLLKTLEALIVMAKQGQPAAAPRDKAGLLMDQSQGIFFAFGKLTEYLSMGGRNLGRGLAALPATLGDLPARLAEPNVLRPLIHMGVDVGILAVLGLILQLMAARIGVKLHDSAVALTTMPLWQKSWRALLTVGLAVGPYLIVLIASGIVLSVFPVGAILSGLVALVIVTLIFYRLTRAIGHVLLRPDEPTTRLLPISNPPAQLTWGWLLRLLNLSAAYYLITHALLTIGVADEVYSLVRGGILVIFPTLLTVLVLRLARGQRTHAAEAPGEGRLGAWASPAFALRNIWPIIAITYVWCTAFFAMAGFRQGVRYVVVASLETAAAIIAILLALRAAYFVFTRASAMNDRVGQYLPGLEVRTLRYLRAIWWSARLTISLVGIAVIFEVWGIAISGFLTSPVGGDILSRIVPLIFSLALVSLVVDLSTFVSQKLVEPGPDGGEVSKKRKTLIPLGGTVVKYGAMVIGGLIVLHQVGVNITPLLAGVGIFSLAIGFGAQTLVKDIINGLFILFEDSISVGDVAVIKGTGGLVEAVNLRTIRLRDAQGNVHIIPNSQVEMITNMTKDFSYYVLDVGVAYREDTDEVVAALKDIDASMRADPAFARDMLAPIEILGVDQFTDSAVIIKARLKTKPIRQWYVGREFNRRMKKLFDERGIEMPFPHRTIYWGEPKLGKAPAMELHVQNPEAVGGGTRQAEIQTTPSDGSESDAR